MSAQSLDRRRMLQLLCALGASGGPLAALAANGDAASRLAEGLDVEALHALGGQFRNEHRGDSSFKTVLALLRDEQADLASIVDRLRRLMLADYRNRQTVRISGWYVSRTEARLIAALSEALHLRS